MAKIANFKWLNGPKNRNNLANDDLYHFWLNPLELNDAMIKNGLWVTGRVAFSDTLSLMYGNEEVWSTNIGANGTYFSNYNLMDIIGNNGQTLKEAASVGMILQGGINIPTGVNPDSVYTWIDGFLWYYTEKTILKVRASVDGGNTWGLLYEGKKQTVASISYNLQNGGPPDWSYQDKGKIVEVIVDHNRPSDDYTLQIMENDLIAKYFNDNDKFIELLPLGNSNIELEIAVIFPDTDEYYGNTFYHTVIVPGTGLFDANGINLEPPGYEFTQDNINDIATFVPMGELYPNEFVTLGYSISDPSGYDYFDITSNNIDTFVIKPTKEALREAYENGDIKAPVLFSVYSENPNCALMNNEKEVELVIKSDAYKPEYKLEVANDSVNYYVTYDDISNYDFYVPVTYNLLLDGEVIKENQTTYICDEEGNPKYFNPPPRNDIEEYIFQNIQIEYNGVIIKNSGITVTLINKVPEDYLTVNITDPMTGAEKTATVGPHSEADIEVSFNAGGHNYYPWLSYYGSYMYKGSGDELSGDIYVDMSDFDKGFKMEQIEGPSDSNMLINIIVNLYDYQE